MKVFAVVLVLLNAAYLWWMQFGGGKQIPEDEVDTQVVLPTFIEAERRLVLVSERPLMPPPEQRVEFTMAPPEVSVPADTANPEQVVESGEVAPVVSEPTPQIEPWCAVAAGFPDENSAGRFVAGITALNGSAEVTSEEFPISSTWWVHLPPFPTPQAADVVLRELQAKNIDSYYVRTGELAGAISLGVFSGPTRAGIAQQELSGKGYSTSIREIVRTGTRFNVALRLENANLRQTDEWTDLIADLPDTNLQEIVCR